MIRNDDALFIITGITFILSSQKEIKKPGQEIRFFSLTKRVNGFGARSLPFMPGLKKAGSGSRSIVAVFFVAGRKDEIRP